MYTCTAGARRPTIPNKLPSPTTPARRKGSLADWILKDRAEMQAQKSVKAPAPPYGSMHLLPEDMIGLPRYVPLTFRIALLLGEHASHPTPLCGGT